MICFIELASTGFADSEPAKCSAPDGPADSERKKFN